MAAGVEPSISRSAAQNSSNWANHRFERITRCKLTIISELAVCKKFLEQICSYAASLQISNSHSLECYVVIFLFISWISKNIPFLSMVYINECIDVNTAFKKFLQIYELFAQDPTVSMEFPTLASPGLFRKTVQSTSLTFLHGFGIMYTKLLIIFIMLSAIVTTLPRLPQ